MASLPCLCQTLEEDSYYIEPEEVVPVRDYKLDWSTVTDWIRDSIYYKHTLEGRVRKMHIDNAGASIVLPEKTGIQKQIDSIASVTQHEDVVVINEQTGEQEIIMRAIRDEESGEMVATEQLQAAVVTARFRNVAERHGMVDLEFDIIVPQQLYDSHWQLRFNPRMYKLDTETELEPVIITGNEYRKAQLKGYQQYNRFLQSIITDPSLFVDVRNLEIFIKRNIPLLYYFKTDSTEVSDEKFHSMFGVTEKEAIDHYTSQFKIRANRRKIAAKDRMFHKYVKVPIEKEGLRLDTVLTNPNGDFVYSYIQTIKTEKNLKKVEITLAGSIFEQDKKIYSIPQTAPLDFYISSLSSFVDDRPHYMMKVIERRAEANASYNIDFEVGKYDVRPELRNNTSEIEKIKGDLAGIMSNEVFDLDSIIVTAYASPEGSVSANNRLCGNRAESVIGYFNRYIRHYEDSLRADMGVSIDLSGDRERISDMYKSNNIRFLSRIGGEDWKSLIQAVETSDRVTDSDKETFFDLLDISNLDEREAKLRRLSSYGVIRNEIYPNARSVKFNFYLHRKGMVKDTVHTTILDTAYMRGIQAIKDRDYELALSILRPYQDYNTAVAFVAMDYNVSAMTILQDLPQTAQIEYLKAIIYARQNDDQNAVQCFMNAARADRTYFNRGNLDPEIRAIIRRYNLDALDQDEYDDYAY